MSSTGVIIAVAVVVGCVVIVGGVVAYSYLRQYFATKNQEQWRKQWRLTHTNSIRGNLVRTYEDDIEANYTLHQDQKLGKGGCGVVICGNHNESGALFAIKTVVKATSERGRLDREIKLLKDVDHTNIVRLFEVYDTPTHVYFVMELCSGGHLGDLLARQTPRKCLEEDWARVIIRQLVSAVAHLHSRGICHRDIKLQNILMENTSRSAQIKLIDFGYGSRFIGALPMRTKCGTPYTTAPEVLRENYDQRCDVWSVGVVSFIVLSGKRPFEILEVPGQLADAGKAVMLTNILMGRFHYSPQQWSRVTPQALDFVDTLLHHDYKTRVQAEDALEHKWLQKGKPVNTKPVLTKTAKSTRAVANMRRNSSASALRRTGLIALVFGLQPTKGTDIRALFQSIDVDNSGSLSLEEFRDAMQQLAPELTNADVQTLFDTIDIDGNHLISYTEFLAATLDPREIDLEEMNKAFRLLDADGNGFIDVSELETVLRTRIKDNRSKDKENHAKKIAAGAQRGNNTDNPAPTLARAGSRGLSLTNMLRGSSSREMVVEPPLEDEVDAKIKDILARCDLNGDGLISYDEFLIAMTENGAYTRRTLDGASSGNASSEQISAAPSSESFHSSGSKGAALQRVYADGNAVGPAPTLGGSGSSSDGGCITLSSPGASRGDGMQFGSPDKKAKSPQSKYASPAHSRRSGSTLNEDTGADDVVGPLKHTASQRGNLPAIGEAANSSGTRSHADEASDDSYGTFSALTASRLLNQQKKYATATAAAAASAPAGGGSSALAASSSHSTPGAPPLMLAALQDNRSNGGFVEVKTQSPSVSPRMDSSKQSNIAIYDGNSAAELFPGSCNAGGGGSLNRRGGPVESGKAFKMNNPGGGSGRACRVSSSAVQMPYSTPSPKGSEVDAGDADADYNHDISAAEIVSNSERDNLTNFSASTVGGGDRRKVPGPGPGPGLGRRNVNPAPSSGVQSSADNNSVASNRCSVGAGADASVADMSSMATSPLPSLIRENSLGILRKGSLSRILGLNPSNTAAADGTAATATAAATVAKGAGAGGDGDVAVVR